jgi:hypothetical protein
MTDQKKPKHNIKILKKEQNFRLLYFANIIGQIVVEKPSLRPDEEQSAFIWSQLDNTKSTDKS